MLYAVIGDFPETKTYNALTSPSAIQEANNEKGRAKWDPAFHDLYH
jgi:hypothetical protein